MSDVYDGRMECLVCHKEKTAGELHAGVCGTCCQRRCLTCSNSLFSWSRLYCAQHDEVVEPMHTCEHFIGRSTDTGTPEPSAGGDQP